MMDEYSYFQGVSLFVQNTLSVLTAGVILRVPRRRAAFDGSRTPIEKV